MTESVPGVNAPLDQTHQDCLEARAAIRAHWHALSANAARWLPRACPDDWRAS
jgi:hypothetical protein